MIVSRRSAFQHPLAGEVGGEPHPLHRAHALDVVGVGGQQLLGDQLGQHVVVALEGGEHVGVGLERDQPVLGEIACAAAGFAGLLDGAGGVPGVGGLEAGRAGLQLALLLGVGIVRRLQLVALGHQLVLRELQRVRPRDQREQPALVHEVVHDQHLVVVVGRLELPALQRISGRDVERHPRRRAGAAADGDPAADQRAEHREEPAARILDRRGVGAVVGDVGVLVQQVLSRDADVVEHGCGRCRRRAARPCSGSPTWSRPGRSLPSSSRIGTTKQCTPWPSPSGVISCAKTAATLAVSAAPPM